ncbi:MAG TPA: DUF2130 domain-containing protein [Chitinophagaceae bacterium]|nr:DUF2130 domain-containing protein [Chitinophagaceae bacterium]
MAGLIVCPKCSHQFEPTDAFREEVQTQLREEAKKWQARKEDEYRQKETALQQQIQQKDIELNKRLAEEKLKLQNEVRESLSKSITADFENRMQLLQQSVAENEEKLKEARRKELEFLQQAQAFKIKEQELELSIQRTLMEEREKLKEQVWKEQNERLQVKETEYELKIKELQKQLDDSKKRVDELKRSQEQGSMQLQGEVQELLLEEILRNTFPFDLVEPVPKGVRGADSIQTVRNQFGNECGRIIYESKRTKDFTIDWIEKLKHDMRSLGADVSVIVTQALPKDMERFGEKDGVYICTFTEVRSVALLLRNSILKMADIRKSQENRGEKMVMLYDYLTGNEFSEQWKAIREGFMSMKMGIQRERDAMEKLWKVREKQLEKVLLNATHIRGSIEGIAGADAVNLNLLEDNIGLLE